MNVFLDTEFTNLLDPVLISLGMVTEYSDVYPDLFALNIQGVITEEFYVEVPYPDNQCTPFVRCGVLPLLRREPDAYCSLKNLRLHMLNWLQIVRRSGEDIDICIDYEADWLLFCEALDNHVPHWVHRKMINQDIVGLLQYDFFRRSQLPQHHALYDARADRYAYRPQSEKDSQ